MEGGRVTEGGAVPSIHVFLNSWSLKLRVLKITFIKMETSNYPELLQQKALPETSALPIEYLKPFKTNRCFKELRISWKNHYWWPFATLLFFQCSKLKIMYPNFFRVNLENKIYSNAFQKLFSRSDTNLWSLPKQNLGHPLEPWLLHRWNRFHQTNHHQYHQQGVS